MAKKTAKKKKSTGRKQALSKRRKTASGRSATRRGARKAGKKNARARTTRSQARKSAKKKRVAPARVRAKTKKTTRKTAKKPGRAAASRSKRPAAARGSRTSKAAARKTAAPRKPVKRSGAPASAGSTRTAPALNRQRRQLRDLEEALVAPPSSLDVDRMASAARTGRAEMRQARREHTETSPALAGGDVDANWQGAYAEGDEAPGGDNPTPDQDRVDDIGKALGVTYEDNEELKASEKIAERDKHRWELDPASSEDYRNRDKDLDEE